MAVKLILLCLVNFFKETQTKMPGKKLNENTDIKNCYVGCGWQFFEEMNYSSLQIVQETMITAPLLFLYFFFVTSK